MIQGHFHRVKGSKAVGSSGHHSDLVVETFHGARGDFPFGPEPIEKKFLVGPESPGDPLHGFEAAAHDLRGPAIQESAGPDEGFVVPDVLKGLLEVPSPGGGQLAGEQRIELAPCMTSDPAGSAQQLPAHVLEASGRGPTA